VGGGAWGGGCMDHFRASHQAERSLIRQALGAAADLAEGAGAIGAARARSLARRRIRASCSAKLMWVSPYRTQLTSDTIWRTDSPRKSHCHSIAPPDSGDERAASRVAWHLATLHLATILRWSLRTANGIAHARLEKSKDIEGKLPLTIKPT